MKKNLLILATGIVVFAACSNEDAAVNQASLQPLQFTASQQTITNISDELTRAADGLYTSTTGFDGTESVKVYFNSANSNYNVGSAGDNHKSTLYGGFLAYPAATTGDAIALYAVYPAASVASHTVAADQSTAENYKASDLMFAKDADGVNPAENRTSTVHNLPFDHQLIKLKLVVTKGADLTAITQIKMTNVKRTVALTPSATELTQGDLSTADENDNIIIFSGTHNSSDPQTYTCVFPAQAWSNTNFLEVTADEQTINYSLTRAKNEWTNGKEYTLNLKVVGANLGMSVDIANWTSDGNVTTYVANGFAIQDIADQTYTGSAITPTPVVIYNGAVLTLGTDYTLSYQNNTAVGVATVYAIGINTYVGKSASKTFNIVAP